MIHSFVKTVLDHGGSIHPLLLDQQHSGHTGVTNPSVFVDNGTIMANIRNVQYMLYHSEHGQQFQSPWGCLAYLHPETDQTLRTTNWFGELHDQTLQPIQTSKVDTSKFDSPPQWTFVGLEDARPVKWDDRWYLCGVRRDTNPDGEGRMELSEVELHDGVWREVSRNRIHPPGNAPSYCEKNWMPVTDMPFHFVKWCNPTEVVTVNLQDCSSTTVFMGTHSMPLPRDLRGSSHVITVGEYRVAVTHEVDLWFNELNNKDAVYLHRFVVWDKHWNVVKVSPEFNFMGTAIEFCCGAAVQGDHVLISFGHQDTSAFVLKVPVSFLEKFINE